METTNKTNKFPFLTDSLEIIQLEAAVSRFTPQELDAALNERFGVDFRIDPIWLAAGDAWESTLIAPKGQLMKLDGFSYWVSSTDSLEAALEAIQEAYQRLDDQPNLSTGKAAPILRRRNKDDRKG